MEARFSAQLENWLKGKDRKTIDSLDGVFGEKSFAVIFLVLMFIPALPIPTGGVTHVFEVIVMLLAIEMVIGRRTIWLPKSLGKREIPKSIRLRLLPLMKRRIAWAEKHSRPRLTELTKHTLFTRMIGLIVFGLSLIAFIAPPFSGLDTLPALGVVILSLGLILEDILFIAAGVLIGLLGSILTFTIGASLVAGFKHLFN